MDRAMTVVRDKVGKFQLSVNTLYGCCGNTAALQAWSTETFHSNTVRILWKSILCQQLTHFEREDILYTVNKHNLLNFFPLCCRWALHCLSILCCSDSRQTKQEGYCRLLSLSLQHNRKYFGALVLSLCQSSGCEHAGTPKLLTLKLNLLPSLLTERTQTGSVEQTQASSFIAMRRLRRHIRGSRYSRGGIPRIENLVALC